MTKIEILTDGKVINTTLSAAIIKDNARFLIKEILARNLKFGAYQYNLKNENNSKVIDTIAADLVMAFVDSLGTNPRVDIIFDILNHNLTTDLDYVIGKFKMAENKASILWGFETVNDLRGDAYLPYVNAGIERLKGTGISSWLDGGLMGRASGASVDRNKTCNKVVGATAVKAYLQPEDKFKLTANMAENFKNFKNYFDVTLPKEYLDPTNPYSFVSVFKDPITGLPKFKLAVVQYHYEGYGKEATIEKFVTGKPLGTWIGGKFVTFFLKNTNLINYACFMSNQIIMDGEKPNPIYFDMLRTNPLFHYDKVFPVRFTELPGVDGVACSNLPVSGGREYVLHLTNESNTEYIITPEEVSILWGGMITGTIKRDTGYGKNGWDAQPTTNEVEPADTNLIIRRNCTTELYIKVQK